MYVTVDPGQAYRLKMGQWYRASNNKIISLLFKWLP
jgi:hypothetical protein